ncbi:MAG TPA: STAS domain-containing protein [Motilibacteraceae bacterium]|nr:STAS domain-containing protein [Motilibacteraceae bacterium]
MRAARPSGKAAARSGGLTALADPGLVEDGRAEDEAVVFVTDALLADGLAELRWLLHDHVLAGVRVLTVDLSGVEQLSSPAVATFLWAHRSCRARGGGVVLRGANRKTLDLLRRTGLWRVLQVEAGGTAARGIRRAG